LWRHGLQELIIVATIPGSQNIAALRWANRERLQTLEKARIAAADLAAILYKPMNILPIGLYVLQKCDSVLVEKKADLRCWEEWKDLESQVESLVMPTDEDLKSTTGLADLLKPWLAAYMKSSQVLPTVTETFKEQRAQWISRLENLFEGLRSKLHDAYLQSCIAVGHAALESVAAVIRTAPPDMTVEEELAVLASRKVHVDAWAAVVGGCENEEFNSLAELGVTSSIYIDLWKDLEVYVDFVNDWAISFPFSIRHWALQLPAAAQRKTADGDVSALLSEDSVNNMRTVAPF
jgi:hypothetical protein